MKTHVFATLAVALAYGVISGVSIAEPLKLAQVAPVDATATNALPAFEFRGHKVGEALPGGCRLIPSSLKAECRDPAYGGMLGDVPVQVLIYRYYDGQLYDVLMTFNKASYQKLQDMLTGKYGAPANENASTVQSRAGAKYDNMTSEWKFAEGNLVLNMIGVDINTGSLVFINPTANARIRADDAAKGKATGAKTF